jgi:hypothetical protein
VDEHFSVTAQSVVLRWVGRCAGRVSRMTSLPAGEHVDLYSSPNLPNAKMAAQHWFRIVNPPRIDD